MHSDCFTFFAVAPVIKIVFITIFITSVCFRCSSAHHHGVPADGGQRACDRHVFIWKKVY